MRIVPVLVAVSMLTVGIGAAPIAPREITDPSSISESYEGPAEPESIPGSEPELSAELLEQTELTECEAASLECPPAPSVLSVTPQATQVVVEWEWDVADDSPPLSGTLLRIPQESVSATFDADTRIGSLTALEPDTEYTVVAYAFVDQQLSRGSDPFVFRTLAEDGVKPLAQPGDVSRLIVTTLSDHNPAAAATAAAEDLPIDGVGVDEVRELGNKTVVIELDDGISNTDAALVMDDLRDDPRVASVEIDARVQLMTFPSSPPDDPYWTDGSLWGLYGVYGIAIASNPTTMGNVWTRTQGSGAVVAVLDTGYTPHPDLDANRVAGYDFVSNFTGTCRGVLIRDGDGDYVDTSTYGPLGWDNNPLDPGDWKTVNTSACSGGANSSWHGTHVSGTIAAPANNTIGVIGVAPQAKVQPVRVLTYDGGFTSDIVAAITWASGGTVSGVPANATPADVINLSLGGVSTCTTAWQTAIDAAVSRGSVVIAAAGNSNVDASNFVPANCNNVVTVAASDTAGNRASFSNFGSVVDIAAPGTGIWSTADSGTTRRAGDTYRSYAGTSMAAPHAAGVAALLKSMNPSITPSTVLSTMQSAATTFPSTGDARQCTTSLCGAGLLSATAVSLERPGLTGISPTSGSTAGGLAVTLTGFNLTGATRVTFGGTSATSLSVTSSTSVTVTTPARAAGAVEVTITTPDGSATLPNAYTFVAPPPPSGGGSSGGGSAGGASSGASSSGGGGGLNAISAINPTPSGSPGTVIALAGWGLETTREVIFNEFSAPFTVVNGGHVEVVVPDVPPGTYVVHAVLAPDVGRASFWDGFNVTPRSATTPDPNPGATPGPGQPGGSTTAQESADFITFNATATSLTGAMRTKLNRLADRYSGVPVRGTIVAFTDARGTGASTRRANARAQNIRTHLLQTGLSGAITVATRPGSSALQNRSTLVLLAPAAPSASATRDEVSSLIVRVKGGRSITVNDEVRGAQRVTGPIRASLQVGPYLGLRMYRIDFAQPVSERVAKRVATQLMQDPGIEFAEPDSIVTTMIGRAN
jgi:serine protease